MINRTIAGKHEKGETQPRLFADILFLRDAGVDNAETLRRFLIEVAATLTRYELALLLSHAPPTGRLDKAGLAERLLALRLRATGDLFAR